MITFILKLLVILYLLYTIRKIYDNNIIRKNTKKQNKHLKINTKLLGILSRRSDCNLVHNQVRSVMRLRFDTTGNLLEIFLGIFFSTNIEIKKVVIYHYSVYSGIKP